MEGYFISTIVIISGILVTKVRVTIWVIVCIERSIGISLLSISFYDTPVLGLSGLGKNGEIPMVMGLRRLRTSGTSFIAHTIFRPSFSNSTVHILLLKHLLAVWQPIMYNASGADLEGSDKELDQLVLVDYAAVKLLMVSLHVGTILVLAGCAKMMYDKVELAHPVFAVIFQVS